MSESADGYSEQDPTAMNTPDFRWQFPAKLDQLSRVRAFIRENAEALQVDSNTLIDVLIAVDELVTNSIVHGSKNDGATIEVRLSRSNSALVIQVIDQSPAFDLTIREVPGHLDVPLEQRPPGGMGIHLIRELMDEVRHEPLNTEGNIVTLVKKMPILKR